MGKSGGYGAQVVPRRYRELGIVGERCQSLAGLWESLARGPESLIDRWRIVGSGRKSLAIVVLEGESLIDRWRIVADRCLKTRIVGAPQEYGKMRTQNLAADRFRACPGRFDCKFLGPVGSQSPGPVCEQNGPGDLLAKRPDPFVSKTGLANPKESLSACADSGILSWRGWPPGADSKPAGSF